MYSPGCSGTQKIFLPLPYNTLIKGVWHLYLYLYIYMPCNFFSNLIFNNGSFFFFFFFFLVFRDRVSLYSPGCPGTHFVDQAGLKLRNPPASASGVLGLKACATTPGLNNVS
jgi:hypothetical protein